MTSIEECPTLSQDRANGNILSNYVEICRERPIKLTYSSPPFSQALSIDGSPVCRHLFLFVRNNNNNNIVIYTSYIVCKSHICLINVYFPLVRHNFHLQQRCRGRHIRTTFDLNVSNPIQFNPIPMLLFCMGGGAQNIYRL